MSKQTLDLETNNGDNHDYLTHMILRLNNGETHTSISHKPYQTKLRELAGHVTDGSHRISPYHLVISKELITDAREGGDIRALDSSDELKPTISMRALFKQEDRG